MAITAAMPGPTGLLPFQERFPDRFFDVGIAEQHAVTGAAGMAMGGLRPVVAIYSTFLNRAWDQVVYDVALHRLPVVFCLDRAGVTGPDGASHHGVYDMALLSKVPGMRVLAPSSAQELAADVARRRCARRRRARSRSAIRVAPPARSASTRSAAGLPARTGARRFRHVHHRGRQDASTTAEQGRREPGRDGIDVDRVGRPLLRPARPDDDRRRRRSRSVITIEDGIRDGGIGMADRRPVCAIDQSTHVEVLGLPTKFIPHDPKPRRILARFGLDADGLVELVQRD